MEENKENKENKGETYSTLSLVFGIASLCLNPFFVLSILGLVFSSQAIKEDESQRDSTIRKAGKATSIVSIFLSILVVLLCICYIIAIITIPGALSETATY